MDGTGILSRLTGFIRGKRRFPSDPAPVLLGLAGFDGKLKFLNRRGEKSSDTLRMGCWTGRFAN